MYRASRAQHSIPEQQHYVDKGVVQGGRGQEHVFLSERNGLNWRTILLMNMCITGLMHVSCSTHRRLNSPPPLKRESGETGVRTTQENSRRT